ncbi:Leader peptidase (Prepilin peptidase) / N-methyltransferase [hydrothermal vent metagenome]|uniref:Leader peptidase (Prepilin peptidase) / N-methyltransferase n=1 Tax=hydrothermal vent metagenome TaxID=652676 RepID=A0A3B1BEB0_9ZZZZ
MILIDYLQHNPIVFLIYIGLLGLIIGSFLNVVIYRLPTMMEQDWREQCLEFLKQNNAKDKPRLTLSKPRSSCPQCSRPIKAIENIPVISYLFLKGRCSGCGTPISIRYPLIELTTCVLSLVVAWHFGVNSQTAAALVLTWALIALSMIDFNHKLLPDTITLPFLWLGLLLSIWGTFTDPQSAIIGATAGYLSLWSIFHIFRLLTGKEGMGYGDFKLLALFGAWLGWQALPQIIMLSSLVGAMIGLTLILALGRDRNIPIPFGPYLAVAGWISMLWGGQINQAYLNWAGIQ